MAESEDTTSGKTVAQTKTSDESEKGQKIISAGRGGRRYRDNARNNTRYSSASTIKYYKGGVEDFGAVLALNYEKL